MRIAKAIASFFYVGFVPVIPGTFGSLGGVALYLLLQAVPSWQIYLGVFAFVTIIGIWAAGRAEHSSGIIDPSFVVIDEVAGMLATLFLIPFSWIFIIVGFVLFRFLDIVKPFPARQAEQLPGGWGIMLDDVIVGIYGNILMHIGVYLWNRIF